MPPLRVGMTGRVGHETIRNTVVPRDSPRFAADIPQSAHSAAVQPAIAISATRRRWQDAR
jgi:hypothetical protein